MKTPISQVPTNDIVRLMFKIEKLINSENKPIEDFMKAYQDLKKTYKAGLNFK